jgi:hypothetical protein
LAGSFWQDSGHYCQAVSGKIPAAFPDSFRLDSASYCRPIPDSIPAAFRPPLGLHYSRAFLHVASRFRFSGIGLFSAVSGIGIFFGILWHRRILK